MQGELRDLQPELEEMRQETEKLLGKLEIETRQVEQIKQVSHCSVAY